VFVNRLTHLLTENRVSVMEMWRQNYM